MHHLSKRLKIGLICFSLFLLSSLLTIACNSQQSSTNTDAPKTLIVGISPWPGYAAHNVAMAKGFFKEAGLSIKEEKFASQTDSDTAFLAGKVDLNWTGLPNVIPQFSRDSAIKVVFQCDYSNGSDGILGRNIKTAADVKGKQVARENVLFEELLLRRYLEKLGLKREDVKTIDLTAADAATSFAAGKVDLAVTYEPWMSKAVKEGKGEVVFSSKNSNIIPDGITAREAFIKNRQPELVSYLQAIDKAVKLIREDPTGTTEAIAKSLGITAAEVPAQIGGVKLYDLQMNKAITFNKAEPMNLFASLEFATKTATEMKLIPKPIDVDVAMDKTSVHAA
jgi:NitT/TauT family transport system substrate-binding protein